jgi:hypothetical protein
MSGVFHIGAKVRVTLRTDGFQYEGVLTDFDDVAIYINGLGFPRDDIERHGLKLLP